jgi:uncharacterized protein (TIGR02266 family)
MAVHRYVKKGDALSNRRTDVRSRLEVEVTLEPVAARPTPPAPTRPSIEPPPDVGILLPELPEPDLTVPVDDLAIADLPHPEVASDLDVEVGLHTETNFYTGLTQDISAGGVFVATDQIRPVGELITLRFSLPDCPTPIVAHAEVRWTRDADPLSEPDVTPGMGLRFLELSEEARAAINRFTTQRESLFYDDQ